MLCSFFFSLQDISFSLRQKHEGGVGPMPRRYEALPRSTFKLCGRTITGAVRERQCTLSNFSVHRKFIQKDLIMLFDLKQNRILCYLLWYRLKVLNTVKASKFELQGDITSFELMKVRMILKHKSRTMQLWSSRARQPLNAWKRPQLKPAFHAWRLKPEIFFL